MTVLVKYCGGCNPRFDRVEFVENVQRDFPEARFLFAHAGITEADIVLVVNGCATQCAAHDNLRAGRRKIIAAAREDYGAVSEQMKEEDSL